MTEPTRPLAGIRVVEVASYVSGPLATMMLADLGADVVKVEPPRGDPLRRFGRASSGMSAIFVSSNRGKRSVALDLKDTAGRASLDALLEDADVLVCNWRPAVGARLGLDDAGLAASHPLLVRVYVTGFGPDGPSADAPTFDAVVQGRVGLGDALRRPDGPALAPMYLVDKVTATFVCQAILAALFARERSGVGDRVDVSLLDAAAYLNFPDVMVNRTFVDHEASEARNEQAAAVRPVRASDGWLVVVPVTGDQVRRACAAVGRADLADELFALTDAAALTARMLDEIEARTVTATVAHWLEAFAAVDVPAGPCLTLDEHLRDEQVEHCGLYEIAEWDGLGRVRQVRHPAVFGATGPLFPRRRAPLLDEHASELIETQGGRRD